MRTIPLVLTGLMLLAPAAAGAQAGDDGASRLGQRLRQGDRVTLVLDSAVVSGKVEFAGPEELIVRTLSGSERVPISAVKEARRTTTGVLLGALIGAGAGAAGGAALRSYLNNEARNGNAGLLGLTAAGVGVGIGIDALVNRERTVYRRQERMRVFMSPALGYAAAGAIVSLEW